ncbi:hypothetical protein LTR16_000443 [Cryomyces antarcticus]|uniref:Uncharacterized protein n=1 Tax=Cryomyces antarcticus TaxID=329879 RepID=A0ABR0KUM0_9PEZI|nr:hypothetical protein LTR39_000364 [Cryomyces antarcticus]KAK5021048.1 hypothetical protein LTR60_000145 [Cryomyces antarcticus]KAK5131774.1 hypothetical protein LTR16_000443 [Cryomyces antarcticus]
MALAARKLRTDCRSNYSYASCHEATLVPIALTIEGYGVRRGQQCFPSSRRPDEELDPVDRCASTNSTWCCRWSSAGEERQSFMGRGKSCLTLPAENLSDDDEGKLERDDTAGGIFESEDLRKGKYEMKHEYEPSDNWGPDTMPLGRADPKLSKTPDVPKEQRFCCLRRGPSVCGGVRRGFGLGESEGGAQAWEEG